MKKRVVKGKAKKKVGRWLYWLPRVLTILFVLFIAMFSLDEFGNGYSIGQLLLGLFMHNIPTFVLIIFLVFAWKWELVGAVGFALAGLAYIAMLFMSAFRNSFEWYMISWSVFIAGPAFVIAFLWWLNWKRKR